MNNPTILNREHCSGGGLQTSRLRLDEGSMKPLGWHPPALVAGYLSTLRPGGIFFNDEALDLFKSLLLWDEIPFLSEIAFE